ncbi:hypothetical protein [Vibrio aestuarianus]|uniref:hypothetical protein n=1 Tax=Vibrio aestuarianus TaxID=28171 RepID=UPI00237D0419|nr:hypothetical protein [Vibrio aestuarianus]MDE1240537.1 hypothetical protein [Vibrio aestuarianus]
MAQCRVHVLKSTEKIMGSGWRLCFQWCSYNYADGGQESGYRFIWKTPAGKLQAARGQARIPNIALAQEMLEQAKREGWGFEGEPKSDY